MIHRCANIQHTFPIKPWQIQPQRVSATVLPYFRGRYIHKGKYLHIDKKQADLEEISLYSIYKEVIMRVRLIQER